MPQSSGKHHWSKWSIRWIAVAAIGCVAGASQAQTDPPAPNAHGAFDMLEGAATNGDPAAQAALGTMYFDGQGVVQDHRNALLWNQRAAAQNRPDALLRLGIAYHQMVPAETNDPPQDIPLALRYWEAAYAIAKPLADQGDAISLYVVGRLVYQNWIVSSVPFAQAMDMIRQSADKGYPAAECYLGFNLRSQHPEEAKPWFIKAASQGSSCGMEGLGYAYEGEGRPDQAQEWFAKAAMLGDLGASRKLYRDYHVTVGDPKLEYIAGGRLNPCGELGLPGHGICPRGGAGVDARALAADSTFQAVAAILAFSAIVGIYGPKLDEAGAAEQKRYMDEESRKLSCRLTVSDPTLRYVMHC